VLQIASRICGRAWGSITLAGQMLQEIDRPWRLVAAERSAKQPTLLRPDAVEARDRREQRIEQRRAHPFKTWAHSSVSCPDLGSFRVRSAL
jgi:hypothetical protein